MSAVEQVQRGSVHPDVGPDGWAEAGSGPVQEDWSEDADLSESDESRPRPRLWWGLMLVASALGMVTSAVQIVERIAFYRNPAAASFCDISAVLSCSNVATFWQSSALGIPNSLIGLAVFAFLASAAFAGVLGARMPVPYAASLLGVTVFMAGFVTWYMAQSAFVMGVLCLLCVGCAVSVVGAGIGLTRAVAADEGLGRGRAGRALAVAVDSRADVAAWLGLASLIGLMLLWGLVLS